MKKLVLLLAVFALAIQSTSCKSKKAQDDTQIVENADVEKIEAEDSALMAQDTGTDVGPVDESLQAALGETSNQAATDPALTTAENAMTETQPAEIAAAPTLDEATLNDVPSPAVAEQSTGITETPISESPIVETPVDNTTAMSSSPVTEPSAPMVTASEAAPVKKASSGGATASLKKISEATPYPHADGWVNTVYIARPKEKLKDISQTIYGSDKTKELKKLNPSLAKTMKGGEKIYYVSPNRPADSTKMLSFYEDTGMIPEIYVAKKGDNLKKVAENLLGYKNAYKEMWTTNPVVSKSILEEGETLRYWKSAGSIPTQNIASNTANTGAQVIENTNQLPSQPMPPPPPVEQMAANNPPPPADLPPPPPPVPDQPIEIAQSAPQPAADIPPPPPIPDQAAAAPTDAASLTPPPPPPPQDDIAAAPEVPAKKKVSPNMEEEEASAAVSSDTTMMLGGVVVLCALFAFALIRRNKKKKEAEMSALSETNVGT